MDSILRYLLTATLSPHLSDPVAKCYLQCNVVIVECSVKAILQFVALINEMRNLGKLWRVAARARRQAVERRRVNIRNILKK
ncbi:hypothetical protein J6590_012915 [Homalodisca vitripennis]|nr:hypothetical protein J6590_012915 [Homalodisca vitripennis]